MLARDPGIQQHRGLPRGGQLGRRTPHPCRGGAPQPGDDPPLPRRQRADGPGPANPRPVQRPDRRARLLQHRGVAGTPRPARSGRPSTGSPGHTGCPNTARCRRHPPGRPARPRRPAMPLDRSHHGRTTTGRRKPLGAIPSPPSPRKAASSKPPAGSCGPTPARTPPKSTTTTTNTSASSPPHSPNAPPGYAGLGFTDPRRASHRDQLR
jgi:hypothetical protein